MTLTETKKGDLAILSNEFLWSLFPVVTVATYALLPPIVSLVGSVFFSVCFFAVMVSVKGLWPELKRPGIWGDLLLVAMFISLGYYVFYYWGLKHTTAGNAGIVALMETFFSYLLFNVWKKEYYSAWHMLGTVLMLAGAFIVLVPHGGSLHGGDFLVLVATMITAPGNFFQQRLRRKISSETILLMRSVIALPVLVLIALIFGEKVTALGLAGAWPLLLLTGVMLLGVPKILWIEGIHRISVTKANALGCIAPALTLLFAFIFLHQRPTLWQFLALAPLAAGLILLTQNKKSQAAA